MNPPKSKPKWNISDLEPMVVSSQDYSSGSFLVKPDIQYFEYLERGDINVDLYIYGNSPETYIIQNIATDYLNKDNQLIQTLNYNEDSLAVHDSNRTVDKYGDFRLGIWQIPSHTKFVLVKIDGIDHNGKMIKSERRFEIPLMKDPLYNYQRLSTIPSVFDSRNLRSEADFSVLVHEGVYWVPSNKLGMPKYTLNELLAMKGNPQLLKAKIDTVYDLLHYIQVSGYGWFYDYENVDTRVIDDAHIEKVITNNKGDHEEAVNLIKYILEGDYEDIGHIVIRDIKRKIFFVTYIKYNGYYYLFETSSYRNDHNKSAIETGRYEDYNSTNKVRGNIHKTKNLKDYIKYCNDKFNYQVKGATAYNENGVVISSSVNVDKIQIIDSKPIPDEEYDTINLRYNAEFRLEVFEGINWVPANTLGKPDLTKEEIRKIEKDPKKLQEKIDTLYEALLYLHISDYKGKEEDNIRIKEGIVNWEHHKPGEVSIKTNFGNCAGISNLLNYLLKDDYEEVGFIHYSHQDGNGHIFNYIKQDGKFYVIDMTHYRNDFLNTAPEEGDMIAYYKSDLISGNIHEVENLATYAKYCVENFNIKPVLFTSYAAPNALPIDGVRSDGMLYITYPEECRDNITRFYDSLNDNVQLDFQPAPNKYPMVWEPFNTKY